MKLCFVILGPIEGRFYTEISTCLSEKGFDIMFVTNSRKFAISSVRRRFKMIFAPDHFDKNTVSTILTASFERKYGDPTLRSLYSSDQGYLQKLVRMSEEEWNQETLRYFRFWERIIQEENIDCILSELGGELIRRTAMKVAEANGVQTLYLNAGPIGDTFFLTTNEMGKVEEMHNVFQKELKRNDLEEAIDFIETFRKSAKMMIYAPPPKLDLFNFRRFLDALQTDFLIEKRHNPYFRVDRTAKNYLSRFFRSQAVRKYYQSPVRGEKYVLFPLHAPWDMQLSVRAPQCFNQEYVVSQCYRALPAGYKLYVKEHPASIGGYDVGLIRVISKMENVRVINPYTDSHSLIKKAAAIIVVNSTVGWEGILYNKPVVVLGHPFYRGFGITHDVDNFYDLPFKLMQALHSQNDEARVTRFVYAVLKSMRKGIITAFDEDQLNRALDKANLSKVSKEIADKLLQYRTESTQQIIRKRLP